MNKTFNIALIVIGVVLLCLGYQASHSTSSVLSNVIRGRPSGEATWMLIAGGIALLAGMVGLFREK